MRGDGAALACKLRALPTFDSIATLSEKQKGNARQALYHVINPNAFILSFSTI